MVAITPDDQLPKFKRQTALGVEVLHMDWEVKREREERYDDKVC
jgi:hypothetical protein